MAVAYRSSQSVTNGTAGTSVTVSKPSGIVDTGSNPGRDMLIAIIAAAGAPTITPPASWTLIDSVASGSNVTMWVYWKLASAEGASWTWTLGSSLRNFGWVGAYTGVDPTSPVYNNAEDSSLTSNVTLNVGGNVTPSGGYILATAATRTASGAATTWTIADDDALTANERADLSTNAGAGTDIAGAVADVAWPQFYISALAATATASQSQTAGVAEMVMLRPYFVPYGGTANDVGVVVEAAFDVDPDSDAADWTWTAMSVHDPAKVVIRHGLSNRATLANPSEIRFTLKNLNGEWTHPTGTYYGKLVRNLPIRVRFNGFGVAVGGIGYHRGTAFLSSARPRWDASENFSVVDIVANGRLRRLQQRDEPVRSAAYTSIQRMSATAGLVTPVAYWPFEDESGSTTRAASAVSGVDPAVVSNIAFAADSSVDGSAPLPTWSSSSSLTALVPAYTPTNTWTVMFACMVPTEPTVEFGLLGWYGSGTAAIWQVTVAPGSPSAMHVRAYNAAGTSILDDSVSLDEATFYGVPQFITVTATQNGTGIDYAQLASDSGGNSGTLASNTVGVVQRFNFSPQAGTPTGYVLGHVALHVQPGATGTSAMTAVTDANAGEWPWERFTRLCDEGNIPYAVQASENQDLTMGPQTIASRMQLIRECAEVEGCVLNDNGVNSAATGGLWFPARDDRDNIAAQLTLDMDQGQVQPGFSPVLDDQDIVNDSEVSRTGGSSGRVVNQDSIDTEGRYDEQVTLNVETDEFLTDLAGWRVNLGTVPGMRFPSVTWNLRHPNSVTLAEDWVNMTLFQRLDIINPPPQYPPDDIATILEGYTETVSSDTWTVTGNLSPYEPNEVFLLAATSGDTDEDLGRLTADPNCALRTAITSSGTSLLVDPNRTRWTTTSDDFPMDIRLGGEDVTLSGIATTAATYVAAGTPAHADNAAVAPSIFAGATAGDAIFVLAAIRSSGTGTLTTPSGYTRLPVWNSTDNVQLYVKVHSGSESAPTITPSGGSSGDTVSAVTFGFRGTPTTLSDLSDMVVTSLTQLNSSAANIAWPGLYPKYQEGCVILGLAWKQDDYTSVAPGVWTESVEASTTTGNDQSLYVAYQIQTTPAVVNEGSWVVTGGASAISRAAVVAIAGGYQTFTASARSVNGVTKAQAAGTLIEVAHPHVLGM